MKITGPNNAPLPVFAGETVVEMRGGRWDGIRAVVPLTVDVLHFDWQTGHAGLPAKVKLDIPFDEEDKIDALFAVDYKVSNGLRCECHGHLVAVFMPAG